MAMNAFKAGDRVKMKNSTNGRTGKVIRTRGENVWADFGTPKLVYIHQDYLVAVKPGQLFVVRREGQ
jgi:hypothetical protein